MRRFSPFRTLVLTVGLVGLVGLCSSGVAIAQSPSVPAASRTVTRQVRPVDSKGVLNRGYSVASTKSRSTSCFADSIGVSGAWRCAAGNYIYDPCWAEAGRGIRVVCVGAPWEHRVVRLDLSKRLPRIYPYRNPPAWGMQLETGNQCVFLDGATGVIGGQRINYGCEEHNVSLSGRIGRRHEPWRIQADVLHDGRYVRGAVAPITIVWDAQPSVFK